MFRSSIALRNSLSGRSRSFGWRPKISGTTRSRDRSHVHIYNRGLTASLSSTVPTERTRGPQTVCGFALRSRRREAYGCHERRGFLHFSFGLLSLSPTTNKETIQEARSSRCNKSSMTPLQSTRSSSRNPPLKERTQTSEWGRVNHPPPTALGVAHPSFLAVGASSFNEATCRFTRNPQRSQSPEVWIRSVPCLSSALHAARGNRFYRTAERFSPSRTTLLGDRYSVKDSYHRADARIPSLLARFARSLRKGYWAC